MKPREAFAWGVVMGVLRHRDPAHAADHPLSAHAKELLRMLSDWYDVAAYDDAPDFVYDALLDLEGWIRTRDEREHPNLRD